VRGPVPEPVRVLGAAGHTYARGPDGRWRIVEHTDALNTWKRTGAPPGLPPEA
jgi:hypothetical protein